MGLEAIYQAPRTGDPHPGHRIYPYLLKNMVIDRPNQVWCADITYIPVQRGFLYLVAIMDWATVTSSHGDCRTPWIEGSASRPGMRRRPDTAAQRHSTQTRAANSPVMTSTSCHFTGVLKGAEITISMDGRGRCMDNIFIERLWRSIKYEAVHLHEPTDGFVAERVIGEWFNFHNTERPHSSFDGQTPAETYGATRPVGK